MHKEIGSEFWDVPLKASNIKYLLSGRTALDYIVREILLKKRVDSALLPSYCCHTMIEPFLRNGIPVRFYDVYYDPSKGLCVEIPPARENEIFYFMEYFGSKKLYGIDTKKIRGQWDVVIDDSTHSWMSGGPLIDADYRFVSVRKWAGFSAIALAVSNVGSFQGVCKQMENKPYCEMREHGFALKRDYISGKPTEKNVFLSEFNRAEDLLEKDYVGYRPSIDAIENLENLDYEFLKKRHCENAQVLIDGLQGIHGIQFMFDKFDTDETPLFVPILVSDGRDELRKFLIDHQVYCPVHWPLSDFHKGLSERALGVYNSELSLVCDQRYDKEDMERISALVRDYVKDERL